MGILKDVFAGNIAYIDLEFVPISGFPAITAINLKVMDSNKVNHLAAVTTLSPNNFRGSYSIPDIGPAGVWVFHWDTAAGPQSEGEERFNVVGSALTTP